MESLLAIGGILGALLAGVISPGPSFVFVAQTAVAVSRRNGVAAALGMGLGAASFAALVLFGLHAVLASVPWLYAALKIAGGAYLVYLALRIWRGAADPLVLADDAQGQQCSWRRSFMLGLGTMLSNPKAVVQYGSIFAALLPREVPAGLMLSLVPLVFVLEAGWYLIVALLLSSASPRSAYLKFKARTDRVAGGVMGLLGLKLIFSSRDAI